MSFEKSYPGIEPIPIGFVPSKKLIIKATKIKNCLHKPFIFRKKQNNSAIVGGDWDNHVKGFDDLIDFYQSFLEVAGGEKWENTNHFKRILKEIETGRHLWGCTDRKSWKLYLDYQMTIFEDIKKNGYLDNNPNERIEVCIGRSGEILFNDGRHRLSYAKYLDKEIPVNIVAIHEQFAKNNNLTNFIDQDFLLFRRRKQILEKYFKFNREDFSNNTVYDIGPQRGVWAVFASQAGAKSIEAVDIDETFIESYNKITNYFGINSKCQLGDICKHTPKNKYDVVLFLGVWHHIPDKNDCYRALDNVFECAKKKIYLEGPVTTGESTFEKHLDNGRTKYHAFYWIPNLEEMEEEIRSRGGKIINVSLGENGQRAFFEVSVDS